MELPEGPECAQCLCSIPYPDHFPEPPLFGSVLLESERLRFGTRQLGPLAVAASCQHDRLRVGCERPHHRTMVGNGIKWFVFIRAFLRLSLSPSLSLLSSASFCSRAKRSARSNGTTTRFSTRCSSCLPIAFSRPPTPTPSVRCFFFLEALRQ